MKRRAQALRPPGPSSLLVLPYDPNDGNYPVSTLIEQTVSHFGRLDVVLNNAGYAINGVVEAVSDAEARAQLEVNFWDPVRISRAAVRYFREENAPRGRPSRVLNVSSGGGFMSNPTLAFYSASKFGMSGACHWMHAYPLCRKLIFGCSTSIALEGFSESLADEIDPAWNIKVSIACICTLNHMR